jgi:steroid delta-isomerase-like uncharacterized protein
MPSASDMHNQFVQAWNSRDFNKIGTLLHPEYTYTGGDGTEIAGGPETGVAIARMYANAFPDGVLELKRVYTQGDTAIAEMVARGAQRGEFMGIEPTGRRIEVHICNVVEIRDGKVFREREYMDMLAVLKQLGVEPVPRRSVA